MQAKVGALMCGSVAFIAVAIGRKVRFDVRYAKYRALHGIPDPV